MTQVHINNYKNIYELFSNAFSFFFHLVDLFGGGLAHPTNGNLNTCQALTKGTMTSFNECFTLNSAPHYLSSVELHS